MSTRCQVMDMKQGALSAKVFLSANFLIFVIDDREHPDRKIYENYPFRDISGWSIGVTERITTYPFYRVN